ncbi:MAG: hypothetical protein P8X57_03210 [Cyclobacteriaceae bacterium]
MKILSSVSDDGLGKNAKKVLDGKSTGVGIKNTDRRLQSIYGHVAGLNIQARDDGYSVSFTIPNKWIVRRDDKLVIMEKETIT